MKNNNIRENIRHQYDNIVINPHTGEQLLQFIDDRTGELITSNANIGINIRLINDNILT